MPDRPPPPTRLELLRVMRRQSEEAIAFAAVFGRMHGLHQTDVAALAAIAEGVTTGAPVGPAQLAGSLRLSRPATTALIDRLEGRGHIIRRPDPADRRRTVLEMQPAARELAAEFFGPLGTAFGEVMDRYTPDELAVVSAFLLDIIAATTATRDAMDPGDEVGDSPP